MPNPIQADCVATDADITSILGNIDLKNCWRFSLRPTIAEVEEASTWLRRRHVFGANERLKATRRTS
jgi:hypothetical protein